MIVEDLLIYGKKQVHSDQAKMLLAIYLDLNPLELLNHLDDQVEEEIVTKYKKSIQALKDEIPIQYVLGNVNFYGNEFIVNSNVLIPRFETEELVEHTLKYIEKYFKDPVSIIDLGTGSGVIGITLKKKLSTSSVTLLDISKEALEVAEQNAKNLATEVTLLQGDMLEQVEGKFDVIISNPPYIRLDEEVEEIVKKNEPSLALYGGVDGLDCYRKILKQVKSHAKEKYLLAFEIGANQKEALTLLVNQILPDDQVVVEKDLQGRNRMLFVLHNME